MYKLYEELKLEELLNSVKEQEIFYMNSLLFSKRNEYEKYDNDKYKFLCSLCKITALALSADNAYEPFGPAIVIPTGRSSSLEDLTDYDIDLYYLLLKIIINPELLARVCDVLWVVKKDYKCAQKAIESYLVSAEKLENISEWHSAFIRIERALRISIMLGAKSKLSEKVISYIDSFICNREKTELTLAISKYILLLQEIGYYKNSQKYSEICLEIAQRLDKKREWFAARNYLTVKMKYDEYLKNDKKYDTIKYISDLFIKESNKHIEGEVKNYSVASHFLEKALIAIRGSGEFKEEQKTIHKRLLEYQKLALKEFGTISQEIEISDSIEWTTEQIRGKSFIDSLLTLSTIYLPTSVKKLREEVEKKSKYFISQYLFGGIIVNENGMVIGRYPNRSFNGDPKDDEEAIRAQMINTAQFYRQIQIPSYIEPARFIINLEHPYVISDFYEIVYNNPFIPPGREYLYAKGLYDGLKGDFINSCHILIPQIENSIRYLLQQNEEVTSGYSSKGIQDERSLTTTLVDYPILKENILGEDLHFELSSLLIDRYGSNLRNRFAHGLISSNGFYSHDSIYLWWLTLRICCHTILIANKPQENI